ncbi:MULTISPECIES: NAD(P)/FAD-dependent oxidoreductase [Rhodococcus]|uniref:NAD(P)-binding protein n=1 Tax=Rhodococcus cercidiphylli TaxID=489916 RepID=A0ABU4AZU7_9NOCA|nr:MULTISPECIES: NAD(P)-binding protein [Rhodococcus]MDV6231739.1 NAD(P)-binding protein [Rhodococcus cercidiphylli]MDV8054335.1 NAD(P)-binding protein [Rhodococcus sp. IEGM 1343]
MNSQADSITDPVTIVGAGIAGAACARVLRDADVPFRIVDRGRAPGGRMSSPELHGRRVDLGAGYFTVRDQEFSTVVADWESAGLARQWANTFGILKPATAPCTTTGPVRWATPNGLRSLVRNMLDGFDIEHSTELPELPDGHVVVAMPDPQAARLTAVPDAVDYVPVIAVACGFDGLDIPFRDAAFVNDHPDIDFVVDDGARRGDGAPVLVVHTTSERAHQHLEDPDGAIAPVLDALRELSVASAAPVWTHAHRWTFAKPATQHDSNYALQQQDGRFVGLAGDQWCEAGVPRVESAWRSGTDVARALIDSLRH